MPQKITAAVLPHGNPALVGLFIYVINTFGSKPKIFMKLLNLQISQAAINKRGNQEQDKNNNKWPQELFGQMFLETLIVSQGHGQKWSRHANPNRARAGKNQGQPGKSNPRPQPFPNVLKNF